MKNRLSAQDYHNTDAATYEGDGQSFKRSAGIVEVTYEPSHFNPNAPLAQQGSGKTIGKWLFNEEAAKAEGILASTIEVFMDTRLEPNASIGLHQHHQTEEIYYLLEGSIQVTLNSAQGTKVVTLESGDVHRISPGESHYIEAGDQGARIIVVAAGVRS